MEVESQLVLHYNLEDMKQALADVKEKMDEVTAGNIRSRGSQGSSNRLINSFIH